MAAAGTAIARQSKEADMTSTERHASELDLARHRFAQILAGEGVSARTVLAVNAVPREAFVPPRLRHLAYEDGPLPIGYGQTISQPSLVAKMTDFLGVRPDETVLEIGTGSGYQAAILSKLARDVYSVEVVEPLAREAEERLEALGYRNVHVRCGDGYEGWPEHAPYDAICVTASAPTVPDRLVEQLAPRGRLIIPVEDELRLVTKADDGTLESRLLEWVRFVPLVHAPIQ
jgi:protein-L-isoaspartate(D-aspartate) O-methyltransferase